MEKLQKYLETVDDRRQQKKVKHKMSDIIMLVFIASLANSNQWVEIEIFAKEHESFLRQYLELPNGIPSHDTIQRVFAMIAPEYLQGFRQQWHELLNTAEGEKIRKLLSLDGKTQRGNGNKNQKANHIVSAVDENGFCIGEKLVQEKSNEITAIPELLDMLNVKGQIITIDAMGTQKEIAEKIRNKNADYVLALKKNHPNLYEDVKLHFSNPDFLSKCAYTKSVEKARSGIETREYWQTNDISGLNGKNEWPGLKTISMTVNTTVKDGKETKDERYFISSLPLNVKETARAIRGHWMVESYHWHLDVTFREDANRTLEKQAAMNLNIIKKLALNFLKMIDVGSKKLSLAKKRFKISLNPVKYLEKYLS